MIIPGPFTPGNGVGFLGFSPVLVPTPTLSWTPLLADIGVYPGLWLCHQRPHQQHHDHPTGPQAAAQQIQGKFPLLVGPDGQHVCPRGPRGIEVGGCGEHVVRGAPGRSLSFSDPGHQHHVGAC